MPRGHYLTDAVKDAIWVLQAEGVSEAEIGRPDQHARPCVVGLKQLGPGVHRHRDAALRGPRGISHDHQVPHCIDGVQDLQGPFG